MCCLIIITVLSVVDAAQLNIVHLERVCLALGMILLQGGLGQDKFHEFDTQLRWGGIKVGDDIMIDKISNLPGKLDWWPLERRRKWDWRGP